MKILFRSLVITFLTLAAPAILIAAPFIRVSDGRMYAGRKPFYFVGANYWYGGLLGLEKDPKRGIDRLRHELDTMQASGITVLRVMAGAEGEGPLNGVERVSPSLEPESGKFDLRVLKGLDILLAEMAKRKMRAVLFLSNNWEWSGGFQQYLIWNGAESRDLLTRRPDWDELRDEVSKFYTCEACVRSYLKHADTILARKNTLTGTAYVHDPTILAWEIANEPRPMRPAANEAYVKFLARAAAHIRRADRRHLITTGHEGSIGTESRELFERVHRDPNIDYLTIHIWPKNWGWLDAADLSVAYKNAEAKTQAYIAESVSVAESVKKPLVIEEFGFPRDDRSFDRLSTTALRDRYFESIFDLIRNEKKGTSIIAGASFWAFGGAARPTHYSFEKGDELTGDPPMEEQGLNTVFDSDSSTLSVIRAATSRISRTR